MTSVNQAPHSSWILSPSAAAINGKRLPGEEIKQNDDSSSTASTTSSCSNDSNTVEKLEEKRARISPPPAQVPSFLHFQDRAKYIIEKTKSDFYFQVFWKKAKQLKTPCYIRPSDSGWLRPVEFTPDGKCFIHFTKSKKNKENPLEGNDPILGEGSSKTAKIAWDLLENKPLASVSGKEPIELRNEAHYYANELAILEYIRDVPGCTKLYSKAVYSTNKKHALSPTSFCKIRFLLELAEKGSLYDAIFNGLLDEKSKVSIAKQLLTTLSILHEQKKLLHRDLKPENIFLKNNNDPTKWEVRIGDFGVACRLGEESERRRQYHVVTCWFAPPEYAKIVLDHIFDYFSHTKNFPLKKIQDLKLNLELQDLAVEYLKGCFPGKDNLLELPAASLKPLIDQDRSIGIKFLIFLISKQNNPLALPIPALKEVMHESLDIWSLGCVLFYLFSENRLPWMHSGNDIKVFSALLSCQEKQSDWIEENDPCTQGWIAKMLAVDPKNRPSAKEVLSWFEAAEKKSEEHSGSSN